MKWAEALRRIADGEDEQAVLEEKIKADNEDFVEYMRREGRPDLAERYQERIKSINSGVYGAKACWSALSEAQRCALGVAASLGSLARRGKEYGFAGSKRTWPHPIRVATIRNLCARDLMAWDGGAFDPEAVAVITERGRFVLKHGLQHA